jgi:hypothetical protein
MSNSGFTMWKIITALSLGVLLIGGIMYAATFLGERPFVPKQFSDARAGAVQTAEGIVSMAKESVTALARISELDKAGKYDQALDLVIQEVNRNNELRDRAEILSQGLGLMTQALSQVKPQSAAVVGVQAIGKEYQIAQKLIDYYNSTYELLDVLRGRYGGASGDPSSAGAQAKINDLITKMNADASAVNVLNEEYKGLMVQFDSLTK